MAAYCVFCVDAALAAFPTAIRSSYPTASAAAASEHLACAGVGGFHSISQNGSPVLALRLGNSSAYASPHLRRRRDRRERDVRLRGARAAAAHERGRPLT